MVAVECGLNTHFLCERIGVMVAVDEPYGNAGVDQRFDFFLEGALCL